MPIVRHYYYHTHPPADRFDSAAKQITHRHPKTNGTAASMTNDDRVHVSRTINLPPEGAPLIADGFR